MVFISKIYEELLKISKKKTILCLSWEWSKWGRWETSSVRRATSEIFKNYRRISWYILENYLVVLISCDTAILPNIHQMEMCTLVHQNTSTRTFIAALSVTAPNWKPSKCTSTVEQITNCSSVRLWTTWLVVPTLHTVKNSHVT